MTFWLRHHEGIQRVRRAAFGNPLSSASPMEPLSGVSTKGFNRAQWWLNFAACATLVLTAVLI